MINTAIIQFGGTDLSDQGLKVIIVMICLSVTNTGGLNRIY